MLRPLLALAFALTLAACQPAAPVGPVTETGTLELGDLTLTSGEYNDTYSVSVPEGQWLSVNVEADGFDPYLILVSPSGAQSDLDDSEPDNTSSVSTVVRADEGGSWDVNVTSFETGETGTYTLTYEVTERSPGETATAEAVEEEVAADEGAE